MDNEWVLRASALGMLLSAGFGVLYGLLTMSRAKDPDECTILPFPLVVSQEK